MALNYSVALRPNPLKKDEPAQDKNYNITRLHKMQPLFSNFFNFFNYI